MINTPPKNENLPSLKTVVTQIMEEYFLTLDGQETTKLYDMVLKEVEFGLFTTVMHHAGGNQSKAAAWLGMARGTLRKRLAELGIE